MTSTRETRKDRVATLPPREGLDRYLSDMGEYSLMTAAEERERAFALVLLRGQLWSTILDHAQLAVPAVELALRAIDDAALHAELEVVRASLLGALAPGPRRELVDALAQRLASWDRDLALATRLVADVQHDRRLEAHRQRIICALRRFYIERNRFACANLRLVIAIARRGPRGDMCLEDRVQEGNLGLLTAIDRFDPTRGFRFSTYAAWWIRHAISRALTERARLVRVPSHLHTLYLKCERVEARLAVTLGRAPTSAELGAALDISPEKIDLARRALRNRSVSTDAHAPETEGGTLGEALADPGTPDVSQALDEHRNAVVARDAFGSLSPVEQSILVQRFALAGHDRRSLTAIGSQLGVSRERVRQLQNAALAKLRARIETDPLPSSRAS
jgi:RNA polymerase primary sigma factor